MVCIALAAVVRIRRFQQSQKIAPDVADLALVGDLVPLGVEPDDEAGVALRRLINNAGIRTGTLADIGYRVKARIAELYVFLLLELDIVFIHVTNLKVAVDQIPVSDLTDDHNGIAIVCLSNDLTVSAGLGPKAKAGCLHNADAGFDLGRLYRCCYRRKNRNCQY